MLEHQKEAIKLKDFASKPKEKKKKKEEESSRE